MLAIMGTQAWRNRCINNPVAQPKSTCLLTNYPVGYEGGLLLIIRKITLFGKWRTLITNGSIG